MGKIKILSSISTDKIISGSTCVISPIVCATTNVKTPVIQLTSGATAGCVLTSDASGYGHWCTPSGGGGLAWTGSTNNGIGTYSSSGTICSEPNLTFDGSVLSFASGTHRCIIHAGSGSGALCINAQTGGSQGGCLHLKGGCGSSFGGVIWLCGGSGSTSGGDIQIYPGLSSSGSTDGRFMVRTSDQISIDARPRGAVYLAYNGNVKLETTSTSVKICCVPAKQTADNQVMYVNSGNCIVSGATVDISTNLSTGDLLYYNGTTISGSTINQTASEVMTVKSNCLMLCSDAAKSIKMCNYYTASPPGLSITGSLGSGYTSTQQAGAVYVAGGNACQTASASPAYGGNLYLCGGIGINCYPTTWSGVGGCVYLQGGFGCGCGYACGGNLYICGGNANTWSTAVSRNGGSVCIFGGCGTTTCGCVALYSFVTLKLCTTNEGIYFPAATFCCMNGTQSGAACVAICLVTGCGRAAVWNSTSDCRCKKNIQPISNALSMITQLNGVCFIMCQLNEGVLEDDRYSVGLIAQDVLPILPEIVGCSPASENEIKHGITGDTYGINYGNLTAVLVEAIKEQQVQICCLQNEINILKGI
jgi:hypothetical protein